MPDSTEGSERVRERPAASRIAARWLISRSDLDSGAAVLLRMTHPLLPELSSAGPVPEGLLLAPAVPAPLPFAARDAGEALAGRGAVCPGEAGAFLARLLSLVSFLRWAGLGVAAEDLPRLGLRPGAKARPWLAAAPVPLWRSVSPHLVVAFAALRLARTGASARGLPPGAAPGTTLRARLEAEAFRGRDSGPAGSFDALAFARRALQAEDEGESAESLLERLVPAEAPDPVRADLLGLVSPVPPEAGEVGPGAVGAAWGPAAAWVLRGASRAATPPLSFLDVTGGDSLEEGSGLRALARGLARDPRSAWVAELANGRTRGVPPPGPPTAVTLRGAAGWDPRSRTALCGALSAAGLRLFEERTVPPSPWEPRVPIRPLVDAAAVSTSVWLPWRGAAAKLEACERLAREAGGDPGRLLAAARRLALEGPNPSRGAARGPALRAGPPPRRRDGVEPILSAAAILAPAFTAEESALAAGVESRTARDSLARSVDAGLLVEAPPGRFAFAREDDRRRFASGLSRKASRDAVGRLEAGSDEAGSPGARRVVVASLARGAEEDLVRAGVSLSEALARGGAAGREEADLLLSRAPEAAPDLGRPALAALAHAAAGRDGAARASAGRASEADLRALLPAGRHVAARLLVRSGEVERALALTRESSPTGAGALARVRLLLLARRDREASREAEAVLATEGGLPRATLAAALLLAAEADGRLGEPVRARQRLGAARDLLSVAVAEPGSCAGAEGSAKETDADAEAETAPAAPAAAEADAAAAATTAGLLASDLGLPRDAAFFFRLALDATLAAERPPAEVDLAVALIHAGQPREAGRLLDSALAGFEEAGDEERWVSALANRSDLRLLAGDLPGALGDVERVLAFDRRRGRERQLLFALPTKQEISLVEGDLAGAEAAFREARPLLSLFPRHDAARHLLVLEGRRLLMAGDPAGARDVLEEAGRLDDNRMADEQLRSRLLASAALDAAARGGAHGRCRVGEPGEEEPSVLAAEERLRGGLEPRREVLLRLRTEAGAGRGAVRVAALLCEWWHRFPAFFATPSAAAWIVLGSGAAARCGAGRLSALLEAAAPILPTVPAVPAVAAVAPAADPAPSPAPSSAASSRSRPPATTLPRGGSAAGSRPLVAEDESTRAALAVAAKVAPTLLTVLVLGETGTGKEVLAREVHRLSGRRGPFVAINVAALPETLAESELFGHARGAFSGADLERAGLVETASGGTLFLDEVGELSPPVQAKLLRVLQEREVRRLGESRERPVDLRVVVATHRDLASMARAGRFREDLLWRLSGAEVRLLPLRERPRDLAALVAGQLRGRGVLAPAARALLASHAWPGNVRELSSALETALAMAGPDGRIEVEHLPAGLRAGAGGEPSGSEDGGERYRRAVDGARRCVISRALGESAGNRSRAADWLGISRQSLLYEMRKLGVA